MRTIAAAVSAQFRSLSDNLYAETRTALARLDGTGIERSAPSLEQIQALLLLAHYELLRMDEGTAMVTAGRCFRLIQLARLGEADALEGDVVSGQMAVAGTGAAGWNEAFAVAEEKRRTFWVAYCFDRFLSSRHEWPLTLQEDAVRFVYRGRGRVSDMEDMLTRNRSERTFHTRNRPFKQHPSPSLLTLRHKRNNHHHHHQPSTKPYPQAVRQPSPHFRNASSSQLSTAAQ
jgi:hypothetical protein